MCWCILRGLAPLLRIVFAFEGSRVFDTILAAETDRTAGGRFG